jgi:hypothetical protein
MPPLLFSLWLMTTPQDRALLLLLNPSRFLTHAVALQRAETVDDATRRSHRVRVGINLLSKSDVALLLILLCCIAQTLLLVHGKRACLTPVTS